MQTLDPGFIELPKGGAAVGRGRSFLERLAEETELAAEPLMGQSIIEISGDRRVLIENHLGVKAYGQEKIVVKVKQGSVCVCGCDLEILRMTREQLIIRGQIDGVTLRRRGGC